MASDSQAERKNRERAILEMVYDVDRFDAVRESENPDFALQHHNQNECFGVEVTESYLTGPEDKKFDSIRTELELFVEFMLQQGVSIAFSDSADEGIELLWANCSILVNDSGIVIRDHADYALPRGICSSDKCSCDSLLDPPFLAFLEDFKKRNTFVTDMSVDVLKDSQT